MIVSKRTEVIRWVITPTRQSLADSRKRTLRSRTVMAARSVWSRSRSRVIESRNLNHCPSLLSLDTGGSTGQSAVRPSGNTRQAMDCEVGPGSESGADACVDSLGTREIHVSPLNMTGRGPYRLTKVLVQKSTLRLFCERNCAKIRGTGMRARSEAPGMERGSLSTLVLRIVARWPQCQRENWQSRETLPGGSL